MFSKIVPLVLAALSMHPSNQVYADFVLDDGDFTNWSFGYYDYGSGFPQGSLTRIPSGGNPDAYLSGWSPDGQFGPLPYAVYEGFVTTDAFEGESLSLTFDIRTNGNPEVFIVIEQNGILYRDFNGVDQVSSNWGLGGHNRSMRASAFSKLDGTGNPNFSGGIATKFGFAIASSNFIVDVDNLHYRVTLTAVPEPSASILVAGAIASISLKRLRRRR